MNINKKLLSGAILLAISVNVCASVPEAACQEGQAPTGSLQPERIAIADNTAAGLYEGPVWLNGRLYFSHFLFAPGFPSSVLAYDGKALTRVLEDSGTNGLALNEKGELISGNHKYKAVSRLDLVTGGHSEVAAEYQGNVFNSPNDLGRRPRRNRLFYGSGFSTGSRSGRPACYRCLSGQGRAGEPDR